MDPDDSFCQAASVDDFRKAFYQACGGGNAMQGDTPFHMLLLGPTGSGKTSLLNLLCNMDGVVSESLESIEHFRTFNDINLEHKPESSMESKTSGAKVYDVCLGDHICAICHESASDDPRKAWVQTRNCEKPHLFHRDCLQGWLLQHDFCPTCRQETPLFWHANVSGAKMRVIDTPGFGDSRGFAYDEKHVAKIIEAIESVEFINAICIVINGRESRLNPMLKYVLSQIASIMPASVFENILVVFTNANDALDVSFDIAELSRYLEMSPANGARSSHPGLLKCTYIENPYARVEKAKNVAIASAGPNAYWSASYYSNTRIAASLRRAFTEACLNLQTMMTMLSGKKFQNPVHTNKFLCVHEKKQAISKNFVDILAEYRSEQDLEAKLSIASEELRKATTDRELNKDFVTASTQKRWVMTPTQHHNTLCNYPGCHCNCHLQCTLAKSFDPITFRGCAAMCYGKKADGCWDRRDTCAQCGHSFEYHYHNEIMWEQKEQMIPVLDDTKKRAFNAARTLEERKRVLLDHLEKEKAAAMTRLKHLKEQLLINVDRFQSLALTRNVTKLLQTQIDLITLHIDALAADASSAESRQELKEMRSVMEQKVLILASADAMIGDGPHRSSDRALRFKWARSFLEVSETASKAAILDAYKRKAEEFGPNSPTGNQEAFCKAKEARKILAGA